MNRQRQHIQRPGVATIAVASVAVYGVYKLAFWAWSRWADDDPSVGSRKEGAKQEEEPVNISKIEFVQHRLYSLRSKRMIRCREDSLSLMRSFAVVLQHSLEESTDTGQARSKLKQLRRSNIKGTRDGIDCSEEDALWLQIQESTLTRTVACAYLQVILVTVLTVHVHLLGGYVFRSAMEQMSLTTDYDVNSDCDALFSSASETHQEVLERTYRRLIDHCVPTVLEAVRSAVLHSIDNHDWNMKNPSSALHMTHYAFLNTMNRIRAKVEDSPNRHTLLQKFFVPPAAVASQPEARNEGDVAVHVNNVLNEAWDLLDSPVVSCAVADCVNHVFAKMDEQIWAPVFVDETDRPIALVISQLRNAADNVFEKDCCNSALMTDLASMVEVADLSFN